MGENRQISHAGEFQAVYIKTPPSRRWSISVPYMRQLLSKEYNMEWEKNFIVEKSNKQQYIGKVNKVTINSDKSSG